MSVTKQDVIDILNLVGIEASRAQVCNLGLLEVLDRAREQAMKGKLRVYRVTDGGKWGIVRDNSDVELEVRKTRKDDLGY